MVHGPCLLFLFIKCHTWETYYLSYSIVLAWFFIYLATYPFLTYIKQRRKRVLQVAIIYFLIAFLFGMISLLYEWRILLFVIVMIPLFIVNMYYARQNERALLNDICAIIVFCIGGLISYSFQ